MRCSHSRFFFPLFSLAGESRACSVCPVCHQARRCGNVMRGMALCPSLEYSDKGAASDERYRRKEGVNEDGTEKRRIRRMGKEERQLSLSSLEKVI